MTSEIDKLFKSIASEMESFEYNCYIDGKAVWISLSKITNPIHISNIFATCGKIVVLWDQDNWGATIFFYDIPSGLNLKKPRVLGLTHPKLDMDTSGYEYIYVGLENPKLDIINEIRQFLGK